jgi:hypothetical protein
MSDFNPGPGWRDIGKQQIPEGAESIVHMTGPNQWQAWVREETVPPLPNGEGYYVIQVTESEEPALWGQVLFGEGELGYWANSKHTLGPGAARLRIKAFEVLSEPRAVTAKAVLNRVRDYTDAAKAARKLEREFGVEP